jgi:hypothetical protein
LSVNADTNQTIVKYVNKTASEGFLSNINFNGKSLNDEQLEFEVKPNSEIGNSKNSINMNSVDEADQVCSFSHLLDVHKHKIDELIVGQVSSFIQLVPKNDGLDSDSQELYYEVKTIKVNWYNDMDAYMHVFSNISSTKKLEKERATNK